MIRAAEAEESRSKVVWAKIQVRGSTKGGLEETEGPELGGVIWVGKFAEPPASILGAYFLF